MVNQSMALDVCKVRKDFPILSRDINGFPLIYFDNAATTQKPKSVVGKIKEYYLKNNSNIHRGVHYLSNLATEEYEETRKLISQIYNCQLEEVIFTKSTTEGINLISNTVGFELLNEDSNILLTEVEHHSNIVPWLILKSKKKFRIKYLKIDKNGIINFNLLDKYIDKNTKIFSFSAASNVFGVKYEFKKIIKKAKEINPDILVVLDAAQYTPHSIIDFQDSGADFIVFSAHKMCGPSGVGVLIGRKKILESTVPFLGGGEMIKRVKKTYFYSNGLPYKFEGGTPNIEGVIGFKEALEYLLSIGLDKISVYEAELNEYLEDKLSQLGFLEIYSPIKFQGDDFHKKGMPLISFNVRGVHSHDVGSILDSYGIAVRTGHHCAQLAMQRLKVNSTVRVSLYFYNTAEEIDKLVKALKYVKDTFE